MYTSKFLAVLTAVLFPILAGPPAHAQSGDPVSGKALFGERSALCHTDDGTKGLAPNLIGVLGRRIATTDFPYSAAMRSKNWSWDEAILDASLQNPQAMLPGIEMPFSIPDKTERRDIIAYIATQTTVPNKPKRHPSSTTGARISRAGVTRLNWPTFLRPMRRGQRATRRARLSARLARNPRAGRVYGHLSRRALSRPG